MTILRNLSLSVHLNHDEENPVIRFLARSGMFFMLAACCAGHALAIGPLFIDDGKWCQLNNESSKDQILQITDESVTVGNVLVKPAKGNSKYVTLSKPKDKTKLNKNTKYLVYFDTTAGALALTIGIGSGQARTQLNFKRAGENDRLVLSPDSSLTRSNVILGLSGFRNLAGAPFITIKDAKAAPAGDEDE